MSKLNAFAFSLSASVPAPVATAADALLTAVKATFPNFGKDDQILTSKLGELEARLNDAYSG
jgi:hypothetical protein